MRNRTYLNVAATVAAVLLALNLMVVLGESRLTPPAVAAQPEERGFQTPFNASEQRREMIISLEKINTKLAAIESRLDRGLSVKVTEMPPMRMQDEAGKSGDSRDLKSDAKIEVKRGDAPGK